MYSFQFGYISDFKTEPFLFYKKKVEHGFSQSWAGSTSLIVCVCGPGKAVDRVSGPVKDGPDPTPQIKWDQIQPLIGVFRNQQGEGRGQSRLPSFPTFSPFPIILFDIIEEAGGGSSASQQIWRRGRGGEYHL